MKLLLIIALNIKKSTYIYNTKKDFFNFTKSHFVLVNFKKSTNKA